MDPAKLTETRTRESQWVDQQLTAFEQLFAQVKETRTYSIAGELLQANKAAKALQKAFEKKSKTAGSGMRSIRQSIKKLFARELNDALEKGGSTKILEHLKLVLKEGRAKCQQVAREPGMPAEVVAMCEVSARVNQLASNLQYAGRKQRNASFRMHITTVRLVSLTPLFGQMACQLPPLHRLARTITCVCAGM